MPSSLCGPNEVKFGMWGFYHQPNNLRGKGLNLKKKFFFNNPNKHWLDGNKASLPYLKNYLYLYLFTKLPLPGALTSKH